ncbi:hypothetical protein LBMAG03_06760 [Actinomycetes bacterium]|nr:hypothetical protein LBMAG03_06760 [Actinomycetes bacterium]
MAIAYFLPTAVAYKSNKNGRRTRGAVAVPVTGSRTGAEEVAMSSKSVDDASSVIASPRTPRPRSGREARLTHIKRPASTFSTLFETHKTGFASGDPSRSKEYLS